MQLNGSSKVGIIVPYKTLVVDEAEGPDWKLLSGLFRAQLIREFLTWSGVVPKVSGRK